jgi:NAD(P)-dependent dehydrogenase (short-subunit alcohol dehydrogenase family)
MRIVVTGRSSTIANEFLELLPEAEIRTLESVQSLGDRYLICTGYLAGKAIGEISSDELMETFTRNFAEIARLCDRIFDTRPNARVCIVGSESGIAGSYDMAYAGAKAAMHLYIETKKLRHAEQMIVGIAPHIIWDSNMTRARDDLKALADRGDANRLGRWLEPAEVADLARFLLMEASPSLSNQVIRMRCS